MSYFLEAKALSFTYRGSSAPALSSASLNVRQGEFVAIMGSSGSGKSTICLALNGLIPRSVKGDFDGEVWIGGRNVADLSIVEIASVIGLVFQQFEAQLFATSVASEVAFGPENLGLQRDELHRRVEEYLGLLHLSGLRHREPATLSGGEKQRLVIASVLSLEPEVLVMDEPTTDLDPSTKTGVMHAVRDHAGRPRTVLVVEQDTETVAAADKIVLMDKGNVVANGCPRDVFADRETMKASGVRSPQMVELFQRLGIPETPLTVAEALPLIPGLRRDSLRGEPGRECPGKSSPVLRARAVSHHYPGAPSAAVDGVSLTVGAGEFIALIGANGSGKTTFAKILGGILKPEEGEILAPERELGRLSPAERAARIGFGFQNPDDQLFAATVREELSFGPRNFRLDNREVEVRVAEALRITGLTDYADQDPFALTKGRRQLLSVAAVLAMRPDVLILDEPMTGLDHTTQDSLLELLARLNRAGKTIIVVTHSMETVAEYASRVIVMNRGRVVLDGTPADIFRLEDALGDIGISLPPVVQLANQLRVPALTVPSLASALADWR